MSKKADCGVVAMRNLGLKPDARALHPRKGMKVGALISAIEEQGYICVPMWQFSKRSIADFIEQNPRGRFLAIVFYHAFAIVEGKVLNPPDRDYPLEVVYRVIGKQS